MDKKTFDNIVINEKTKMKQEFLTDSKGWGVNFLFNKEHINTNLLEEFKMELVFKKENICFVEIQNIFINDNEYQEFRKQDKIDAILFFIALTIEKLILESSNKKILKNLIKDWKEKKVFVLDVKNENFRIKLDIFIEDNNNFIISKVNNNVISTLIRLFCFIDIINEETGIEGKRNE